MKDKFYIYAYLDPRKPGAFKYGEYSFDFEPFYIGKGSGDRDKHHLRESRIKNDSNRIKLKIISDLYSCNSNPIIIRIKEGLSEDIAYQLEYEIINTIGKKIDGSGPLSNLQDGGDGFTSEDAKKTWDNPETRKKRISGLKNWWSNLSEKERKEYSDNKIGEGNPFFGQNHTDEFKENRSVKYSGEGNPMFGRTGEDSPHFGKKHTKETSAKKSKAMKAHYASISEEKLKENGHKISEANIGNPKMCGENNGNNKLTSKDVIFIREFYENNKINGHTKTIRELMNKYSMAYSSLDSVVKRKTWKDVD